MLRIIGYIPERAAAVAAGLPPRPLQPLLPPPPTAPASDLEVRPGRGRRARRRGASVRRSACAAAEGAAASGGVCGAWWGLNYRASPRPQPICPIRGCNFWNIFTCGEARRSMDHNWPSVCLSSLLESSQGSLYGPEKHGIIGN